MKFSVGDRVAVYGLDKNNNPIRKVATITDVYEKDGLIGFGISEMFELNSFDLSLVHPKQCRRLKKKKPQEIYITVNALERLGLEGSTDAFISETRIIGERDIRFIRAKDQKR